MAVIQIRKAQREGARLVVGMIGVSSSGKTHTALLMALGLAKGDPSKIGFLDTENKRGSLYADVFQKLAGDDVKHRTDEPFLIGDLYPPFSPQRYIDAIDQFQAAGVEVLIIDSATHEWEGTGGCTDIAEAGNPRMPNWNKAKAEHKRFMNKVLQCDMHIIMCIRAREKAKPEKVVKDGKTVTEYQDLGLQPITEKNVPFELTVSMMVHDQGTRREILKCPSDLRPYFDVQEKYIGVKQGVALRQWVDGAKAPNKQAEAYRNRLLSNTEKGLAHIESCWQQVPADMREMLGGDFYAMLKSSAAEYDRQREEAEREKTGSDAPPLLAPAASHTHASPSDGAGATAQAEQTHPQTAQEQPKAEPTKAKAKPKSQEAPQPAAEPQKVADQPQAPDEQTAGEGGITVF
jgi:hypothetical protein